ncbi:hypothetical protein GT347_23900 [Xylophilus rhododendri]|uniref:Lipoprotein n=1 Tax=Xylophilus rhododendri TaxID=2697032 RepID=A0A857JCC8_9BURK|nr:hypothetical protein [Xylophilus rhododendri]QHJ00760.1 hypothetical protein GT347_23900 [Xylophilus rhododendri]
MRLARFSPGLAAVALAAMLAACSHTPLPEIPEGLRPRAEPIEPDVAARLFAEVQAERDRLTAAQATEEAQCYQRFVVNACLLEVRDRYRPQLNALNHRDTAVRAGERQRHELERLARVEEQRQQNERDEERARQRAATAVPTEQRQADLDRRNADRAAAAPGNAARAQANRSSAQQSHEKAVADQAQRAAAAPDERRQYDERVKAAQERREAQARREQENKDKVPAQPLPETPAPPSPPVQVR